ncbi:MAG: NAD(+)/NADH kinase, partial [Pseudodesulfovibrio sp.]|nr:NAD(+)/NADH kinase [Pseudodesulfovibrio sp.]
VCRVRVEELGGEVNLTEDGQSTVRLHSEDEIVIRKSGADMLVVDFGAEAYFEKMKKHGFLTER